MENLEKPTPDQTSEQIPNQTEIKPNVPNETPSKIPTPEPLINHKLNEILSKLHIKNKQLIFRITATVLAVIFIAVVVATLLTVVKNGNVGTPKTSQPTPPKTVLETFYKWYIEFKGNPIETGAYKTPDVSSAFVNNIENKINSTEGLNYDPFVCSQSKPLGVSIDEPLVSGNTALATIHADFGQDTSIKVHMLLEGNNWVISFVDCPQIEEEKKLEEGKITTKVVLYFNNNAKGSAGKNNCGLVYRTERTIDAGVDPLKTALNLLFAGPTRDETAQGFSSIFSEKTKDSLKEVKIVESTAYVNLNDIRKIIPEATTSCESANFINQISETIKHYRKVDKVIFAIDGNVKDFYGWMQIGCYEGNNNCDDSGFK